MKTELHTNQLTNEFLYVIATTVNGIEIHISNSEDDLRVDFYASCFGKPINMTYSAGTDIIIIYRSIIEIIDVINWRIKEDEDAELEEMIFGDLMEGAVYLESAK